MDKLNQAGASNMFLSQAGPSLGRADFNFTSSSAIVASSTLEPAHRAVLAVDGLASSYWVLYPSWTKQALCL
jgi:hypothetical protein